MLVSLTVVRNATQTHVTGAKNWAAVKSSSDDVIVEATTDPNNEEAWNQITWSGDGIEEVPGRPNQRKVSRANSDRYHVEASLGGVSDHVDIWVLWATVTILTSGTTPPNAVQYGARYDGTENLGARSFDHGNRAVGKVVPVATITPAGVHSVVMAGWGFRREMQGQWWQDGARVTSDARFFKAPAWVDDTSHASFQNLTPDSDDKIYDRDAPDVGPYGTDDAELYHNFRQWIEWNADQCSDKENWHWRGRWQRTATPQVTLKEVGTGHVALPSSSHFHP